MSSSSSTSSSPLPKDVAAFLQRLARTSVTTATTTTAGAGATEPSHLWITDGLLQHCEFIVGALEDPQYDEARMEVLQELLDLNAETRRVELLLHMASVGLDQAICGSVAASSHSGTASSTAASVGKGAGDINRPSNLIPATGNLLRPLLRLVHIVLKYIIAAARGDTILLTKQIDRWTNVVDDPSTTAAAKRTSGASASPSSGSTIQSVGKATRLCHALLEFTIRVPLDSASLLVHYEATLLMLAMTTTQLHHPPAFDEQRMDMFLETMLASDILLSFIATLMQRVVAWGIGLLPEGNAYVYRHGYQPTYRNLYNLFGSVRAQHCISVTEWLGRNTSQLLALFVMHQRGNGVNHASDALRQLSHGEFVDFELLLRAIERKVVTCPSLGSLLYVLLVDHPTFLHATLTTWPHVLCDVVTALLQLASTTTPIDPTHHHHSTSVGSSSDQTSSTSRAAAVLPPPSVDGQPQVSSFQHAYVQYLVASILCVLSKDRTYHEVTFSSTTQATFVQDRYIKSISVGGLTLAICAKAVARALSESSEPLAQLYLSTIENASPFAKQLHPYASGRIMALLTTITKRLVKIELSLRSSSSLNADVRYRLLSDRQMLLSPMQYLTESIAAMIEGQHRANHTLTYELLYHRSHVFLDDLIGGTTNVAAQHVQPDDDDEIAGRLHQLQDILAPLRSIIANYEAEMASVAVNHSPEDILALIDRVANSTGAFIANATAFEDEGVASPEGRHEHQGRELLYLYQESKESHTFFVPFVWATMISEVPLPGAVRWTSNESLCGGYLSLFYPDHQA